MNEYTLDDIKEFIDEALEADKDESWTTSNEWLDGRYQDDIPIIGHTNPYYLAFYIIAMELEPIFSVELGSWRATAAAHLAFGHSGGKVVTIDIHKDDQVAHQKALEAAAQFPNLDFIHSWTWDAIDKVKAYNLPIDILYIDAWHKYDYVMKEWELYSQLLSDGALVICDDVEDNPGSTEGMMKFWNELDYEKFLTTDGHYPIHMGYLIYEK